MHIKSSFSSAGTTPDSDKKSGTGARNGSKKESKSKMATGESLDWVFSAHTPALMASGTAVLLS